MDSKTDIAWSQTGCPFASGTKGVSLTGEKKEFLYYYVFSVNSNIC